MDIERFVNLLLLVLMGDKEESESLLNTLYNNLELTRYYYHIMNESFCHRDLEDVSELICRIEQETAEFDLDQCIKQTVLILTKKLKNCSETDDEKKQMYTETINELS